MPSLDPLAPDVWRIPLLPAHALNAYLIGDVLVDAGLPRSAGVLLATLADRPLSAHVLTHAHPDHQGASARICADRGLPLWVGARDRAAAESGAFGRGVGGVQGAVLDLADRIGGPGCPVSRVLYEGDAVADFVVVETPGHTPGHIALWRERDGVLLIGDVASYRNPLALHPGLRASGGLVTRDREVNRRSIRKLAALRPRRIGFGHGPPLRDGEAFARWAASL